MTKVDHHVHTSRHSPDSVIDPDDLILEARNAGLDAVVITEHDHQWNARELKEINARADGIVVLSGAEISTRQGHFLVYGLPDLRDARVGIDVGDLLRVVRRHNAAIVAAHPFRWDQDFEAIIAAHGASFDALELVSNNVSESTRQRTVELLRKHPSMAATGSSDGHENEVVGCYYSEFPGPIRSMADFVAALRARHPRPRHGIRRFLACGRVD
jgi:predicted metal-dependent phosphoesterase TrpH